MRFAIPALHSNAHEQYVLGRVKRLSALAKNRPFPLQNRTFQAVDKCMNPCTKSAGYAPVSANECAPLRPGS